MTKIVSIVCCAAFFSACGSQHQQNVNTPGSSQNIAEVARSAGNTVEEGNKKSAAHPPQATDCLNINVGNKALLKSQTFAIDFEPFKGACFVTAHNPEYKDPPMDSEIAIYRAGTKVFTFPEQFNGVQTGCWVEAVAFHDVNGDNRTDIVVIGKCSAKTAPYFENSIYVNDGKTFFTRVDSNYPLSDFKTAKDVIAYAKRNPAAFLVDTDASASNR